MNGGVGSGQACFVNTASEGSHPRYSALHDGHLVAALPLHRGEVFQYTFSVLGLGLSAGRTEAERQRRRSRLGLSFPHLKYGAGWAHLVLQIIGELAPIELRWEAVSAVGHQGGTSLRQVLFFQL